MCGLALQKAYRVVFQHNACQRPAQHRPGIDGNTIGLHNRVPLRSMSMDYYGTVINAG